MSAALAGGLFTTELPGKCLMATLLLFSLLWLFFFFSHISHFSYQNVFLTKVFHRQTAGRGHGVGARTMGSCSVSVMSVCLVCRKWGVYKYFSKLGSVQFSHSVMSGSLQPHESQHARLPCPSPTPRVHSLTSIESVMSSSHLILGHPLLLLPPIPPSIKVFSNESTLRMRWPKY